jgi:hypothetical protein
MPARNVRPRRPVSARRALFDLLWRPAAWAIPFALFFGTLFGGRGLATYVLMYKLSLVFAYTITFAVWVVERFVVPRVVRAREDSTNTGSVVLTSLWFVGTSIAASYVAATVIHFTLLPGFLGGPRQFVIAGMFSVLFSLLALGIALTVTFYRRAIDRARADEELSLARRIQRSFLLSEFPELPGVEIHATNLSSRQVSGDFYDLVPAGPNAWLLAIADVSGKGVPAALLTSMLQASLRTQAGRGTPVAEILANMNRMACQRPVTKQFATFFLAHLDLESSRLTYSNAGHNWPIVFRADGGRRPLAAGGTVLGMLEDAAFEQETLELGAGDRVLLYTDGVTEAEDAAGEMFGEERLDALVHALPATLGAREISDRVLAGVREFLDGVEAGDDITLMILRVTRDRNAGSAAGRTAQTPR